MKGAAYVGTQGAGSEARAGVDENVKVPHVGMPLYSTSSYIHFYFRFNILTLPET